MEPRANAWPPGDWCSSAWSTPSEPRRHSKTQRCIWPTRHETLSPTYLAFWVRQNIENRFKLKLFICRSSMGSLVRPERACVVKHCHIWRFFHHPCIAKEVTICTKIQVSPTLLLLTFSFLSVRLQNSWHHFSKRFVTYLVKRSLPRELLILLWSPSGQYHLKYFKPKDKNVNLEIK